MARKLIEVRVTGPEGLIGAVSSEASDALLQDVAAALAKHELILGVKSHADASEDEIELQRPPESATSEVTRGARGKRPTNAS